MSAVRRRLPWLCLGFSLLMSAVAALLTADTPDAVIPGGDPRGGSDVAFALVYLAFSVVGAMVVSRQPRNAIGWLFVAFGMVGVTIGFTQSWALHALFVPDSPLPAGRAAAWLHSIQGSLLLAPLILVLMLFPDGRLLWNPRLIAAATALATAALLVGEGFDPGRLDNLLPVANPLGVEQLSDVAQVLQSFGVAVSFLLLMAGVVSLVVRFRRSRGREREQIKWFAAGTAFAALLFGGVLATALVEPLRDSDSVTAVTDVLVAIAFIAIPLSAGVAILRHRLWDIDVVIRRTVVYGALTATLAGCYLGLVLLISLAIGESDLAIAGSTLAVAALFRPLRTRIQRLVDRRFFRSRYDAARTLESFGARARDEVSLDALSADLRRVIADTMQPAHVSVWLRRESEN